MHIAVTSCTKISSSTPRSSWPKKRKAPKYPSSNASICLSYNFDCNVTPNISINSWQINRWQGIVQSMINLLTMQNTCTLPSLRLLVEWQCAMPWASAYTQYARQCSEKKHPAINSPSDFLKYSCTQCDLQHSLVFTALYKPHIVRIGALKNQAHLGTNI